MKIMPLPKSRATVCSAAGSDGSIAPNRASRLVVVGLLVAVGGCAVEPLRSAPPQEDPPSGRSPAPPSGAQFSNVDPVDPSDNDVGDTSTETFDVVLPIEGVTITAPATQSILTVGATQTITAVAASAPEFFANGSSIGVGIPAGGGRFSVAWTPTVTDFDVLITAKVPDDESPSVRVAVAEENHIETDLSLWSRTRIASVTPDQPDPHGGTRAYRVTCAANDTPMTHTIVTQANPVNSTPDPGIEIWAKADTASILHFYWQEDGAKHHAYIDLLTGQALGAWASVKIVETLRTGWKRIWFRSLGGTMSQSTMRLSICKEMGASCMNTTTGTESVYLYAPRVVDGPLPFTAYQLATPSYVGIVDGAHRWSVRTPYVDEIAHTVRERFAEVVVPDDYDPTRKYPVLYVGEVEPIPKVYANGLQELRALNVHNEHQCILAHTHFGAILPWYASHVDGIRRYDVQVTDVLVGLLDEFYSTIRSREGRLLIGFSKSGFGAFSLILRNPEVFGYAAAWDTPWLMSYGQYGSVEAFGAQSQFDLYNPIHLLSTHAASVNDRTRLVLAGSNAFNSDIEPMAAALDAEGIPYILNSEPAPGHDWDTGWLASVVDELLSLRP